MVNKERESGQASEKKDRPFTDDEHHETDGVGANQTAGEASEPSGAKGVDVKDAASENDNELAQQLAEQKSRAEEYWNQLLRLKAEMDNLRKRHSRELEQAHKYAVEKLVTDVIPVKDSLELGLQAATADGAEIAHIIEGMELTHKMMDQVFDRFKIECVDPVGEKFDPEKHEAMSMLPSNEFSTGKVMNVVQKGYLLNGRTVRPAMVVVSKGPGPEGVSPSIDTSA
jgi:molecular chaperone GrpE